MNDNLPILIGVGQVVDHWDGVSTQDAPSPLSLITGACRNAVADTGIDKLAKHIDYVAIVRLFSDSLPMAFAPFGSVDNYPEAVAKNLGAEPNIKIYSTAGGEQPQSLVNELAKRLNSGESKMGLIAGGEATGALKLAMKHQHQLDWSCKGSDDFDDRGAQTDFISHYEIKNGLGMPPQTYACQETALRNRMGLSKNEYLRYISEMFANLSEVATNNPFSQFPEKRSAEFLATQSTSNFPVCEPYLKWHVAQDAVNQAASFIMTTIGFAKELNIDPSKWVFLHGHTEVKDKLVSERPDLSRSLSLELAINESLLASDLSAADIKHQDLYSCFPIVPYLAAEVLGLSPLQDQLTVTGGLPFFGGPGNNYSTHAIASMVELLRNKRDDYGMVVTNGGFLSKQAVGIYSTQPPQHWQPFEAEKTQQAIDSQEPINLLTENGDATITAYGIRHSRSGVDHCYVVAENGHGRYLATVNPDNKATMSVFSEVDELLGKTVHIHGSEEGNTLVLDGI